MTHILHVAVSGGDATQNGQAMATALALLRVDGSRASRKTPTGTLGAKEARNIP